MKPIAKLDLLHGPDTTDLCRLISFEDFADFTTLRFPLCPAMSLPHQSTISDLQPELASCAPPPDPRLTWTPANADNAIWAQPVRSFC